MGDSANYRAVMQPTGAFVGRTACVLRTSLVLSGVLFAVCCSTHRTGENSGKPNAASEKAKPEVSQNAGEAQTGPAIQPNPSRFRFLGRVLDRSEERRV